MSGVRISAVASVIFIHSLYLRRRPTGAHSYLVAIFILRGVIG
jgi:hypothetical protein